MKPLRWLVKRDRHPYNSSGWWAWYGWKAPSDKRDKSKLPLYTISKIKTAHELTFMTDNVFDRNGVPWVSQERKTAAKAYLDLILSWHRVQKAAGVTGAK